MENKVDKVFVNKSTKILKIKNIKNIQKNLKEKNEDKNMLIKNNCINCKYNKNNLKIKNTQDNINKDILDKKEESLIINTLQDSSKNKITKICDNFLNQKNERNIKYKFNNCSDMKIKKAKSNFNSIILNFRKENPLYKNKLNMKQNLIKNNKKTKANISYIKKSKINRALFKDIFEINNEYYKTFKINTYSKSFVNDQMHTGKKFNLINEIKNKYETNYSKKKGKNIPNRFEVKKNVKHTIKSKFNFKNILKRKINEKKYSSLVNLKELKNNEYKLREVSSPSFKKKILENINENNMTSFERINSHNILITNININLFRENENSFLIKSDENRYNNLNFETEIISEEKNIDLERIYLLELKALKILKKINDYIPCDEECLNWIDFYFGIKFYDKVIKIFKKTNNYKMINNYSKIEIICYYLCYDISLSQNFNKASILLKAIINILHQNNLILMNYLLYLYNNSTTFNNNINNNNDLWVDEIEKLIEKELKINLSSQDMNEDSITSLICNTIQNILNYYKMIIDNLYTLEEDEEINKNDKEKIVSEFFKQIYKSVDNYSFENLKLFFYSTLNKQNKYVSINQSQEKKYYLSRIKTNYKYSLLINLDETLIYNNKSIIILRPNLFHFLSKIKEMFEIIAFSFYPNSIIDKALELIEKKTKYFDYVLYSNQLTTNYNGKLIKDIENLGRNIKHIIIVDSKINIHKKFKSNLILIKRFLGDITLDINILKKLGYILQNIKIDNIQDDLRSRIHKYKNLIKAYLL